MRKINKIILHQSDSSFADAKTIRDWHVNGNGWSDIGYHYVILNGCRTKGDFDEMLDGVIENGRPLETAGAHCAGENSDSIGICLIGVKDVFTEDQFISLKVLIKSLLARFDNLTLDDIHGHYEFSTKSCPGFNVPERIRDLFESEGL